MKISVIIVNYNVEHFLRQCLISLIKSCKGIDAEIIIVDNNSIDGSCAMIEKEFSNLTFIANKNNVGFSKANNQGIRISKGEYVLLLNPDTLVQEDSIAKCLAFMDSTPNAGALGVKMIDGKGNFLPESKRGLPTPSVAFFKMFGLSQLFSKSRLFNQYHLGFLDMDKTHSVDVLSGAFMLIRKTVLDKAGLLDETFFMYGEDIDLSYRIQKAGYHNYYFSDTTIIHYKGESTKKGSINYVLVFYNAMLIFVRKHYSKYYAGIFSLFIHFAIYLKVAVSLMRNVIQRIAQPLLDASIIFIGFWIIKPFWEQYKFSGNGSYPDTFLIVMIPLYLLIWIGMLIFSGAYDKPYSIRKISKGILLGTIFILIIYALLPQSLRFSRALILLGTIWALLMLTGYRILLHLFIPGRFRLGDFKKKTAIIGSASETEKISSFLQNTHAKPDISGRISIDKIHEADSLGSIDRIDDIIRFHKIEEIIFCGKDLSSQEIISTMLLLSGHQLEFKIAPPESLAIIGSNSIHTSGELYLINLNSVNKPHNRRIKRLVDIIISFLLLITWPILFFYYFKPIRAFQNMFHVLIGIKTWIGYPVNDSESIVSSKPFLFCPSDGLDTEQISSEYSNRINMLYAKDYKAVNDLNLIFRNLKKTGNK